eukprot:CAMPEP_0196775554 /NCGR_PEP_ID=MMETSP1104-20130614/4099_1 /TAXON_ID=33652 /ORGANISM="Cafeteria sp., Strain Caron Lab Isolate" /LENGTH=92 /DNA_ID=CAMNT_0042145723 /DNA_START=1 /DNA_END=276 /DNA_ORIENTATION=+
MLHVMLQRGNVTQRDVMEVFAGCLTPDPDDPKLDLGGMDAVQVARCAEVMVKLMATRLAYLFEVKNLPVVPAAAPAQPQQEEDEAEEKDGEG